jgi:magnesium transporter
MIRSYGTAGGRLVAQDASSPAADAVWYDLLGPDEGEERAVGGIVRLDLPTREDRQEIEVSSRLYTDGGALVMTATIPAQTDSDRPTMAPVSFILAEGRLVTIRDHEPRAFDTFARRAQKLQMGCTEGDSVLIELLDEIVDRLADVLERVARDVDALSRQIFTDTTEARKTEDGYRALLREIGRKGDLASNIRESLLTLERMASFLGSHTRGRPRLEGYRDEIASLGTDVRALSDHADFIGQKINFLLDATLGFINIRQNAIMQLFSVVAVVFLPPTLVASIYGMNFEWMPELTWPWGYPMALGLMAATAVGPYLWFRRKGWL